MIHDPALPELAHLTDLEGAAEALDAFGFTPPVAVDVLSHRRGNRAVLRLSHSTGEVFCKLMQPEIAGQLAEHHRFLRQAGLPVPRVIGYTDGGALFLTTSEGTPGPDAVLHDDPEQVLDAIDDIRERFANAGMTRPARESIATRIEWFLEQLMRALPDQRARLEQLGYAVVPTKHAKPTELHGIHGDLHIAQLFFADGAVSGVIDVDTAGLGEPDNDSANCIAHAIASAIINDEAGNAEAGQALGLFADAADRRWIRTTRARALTAVHLLGHAQRAVAVEHWSRARKLIALAERSTQSRS